jgi:hypothetical protein
LGFVPAAADRLEHLHDLDHLVIVELNRAWVIVGEALLDLVSRKSPDVRSPAAACLRQRAGTEVLR